MALEYIRNGCEKSEQFHSVLAGERFHSWIEQLDLPLRLVQQKIGFVANVRRTISQAVRGSINQPTKGADTRLQLVGTEQ